MLSHVHGQRGQEGDLGLAVELVDRALQVWACVFLRRSGARGVPTACSPDLPPIDLTHLRPWDALQTFARAVPLRIFLGSVRRSDRGALKGSRVQSTYAFRARIEALAPGRGMTYPVARWDCRPKRCGS